MSTLKYVQGDSLPALRVRLQSGSDRDPVPIDVSADGVSIRAHVRFEGAFKESVIGTKVTGNVTYVDTRTGKWEVDTNAPYNVPGKGGIVVFFPPTTLFDQAGDYDVEYEIDWGGGVKQTVFLADRVLVREQFA